MKPPNQPVNGVREYTSATGFDQILVGYAIQKTDKKLRKFLFNSTIRFNYSAGIGFGFNRSQDYYQESFARSDGGVQTGDSYIGFDAIHYRDGIGIFGLFNGGFDFINKKRLPILALSFFYNKGFTPMAHFNVHYKYGFFSDPQSQIEVFDQVVRTRGSTIGFSLGIPIVIKK